MYSQIHLVAYNPVDLYFRLCRAILNLKSFIFYFIWGGGGGFTCLKSRQLTLQNPKKIKDTRSMTGGYISRFISDNLLSPFKTNSLAFCLVGITWDQRVFLWLIV